MMKNLFIMLGLIYAMASCKTEAVVMGSKDTAPAKPYIKQRNGTISTASDVTRDGSTLTADGHKYKADQVAAYGNTSSEFINLSKRNDSFAEKIFSGKINVYNRSQRYIYTERYGNGSRGTSTHVVNTMFIQHGPDGALLPYNINNLALCLPATDPLQKEVRSLKRSRKVVNALRWTSVGVAVAAFTVGGIAEGHDIKPLKLASYCGLGASVGCLFISEPRAAKTQKRAKMIVGKYNGIDYDALETQKRAEEQTKNKPVDY